MVPSINAQEYALLVSLETEVDDMTDSEFELAKQLNQRGLCDYIEAWWEEAQDECAFWYATAEGRLSIVCYRLAHLGAEVPA